MSDHVAESHTSTSRGVIDTYAVTCRSVMSDHLPCLIWSAVLCLLASSWPVQESNPFLIWFCGVAFSHDDNQCQLSLSWNSLLCHMAKKKITMTDALKIHLSLDSVWSMKSFCFFFPKEKYLGRHGGGGTVLHIWFLIGLCLGKLSSLFIESACLYISKLLQCAWFREL